jgi:hypothetical protein
LLPGWEAFGLSPDLSPDLPPDQVGLGGQADQEAVELMAIQ